MNVFRYEFKSLRGALFWWTVAILATSAMFLALYPSFTHDVATSKKLLEGFPPQLRQGLNITFSDFFTFFGFYNYSFTYIGVVGAVFACVLGLGTFSKEARSKTTDFLLSKPITRSDIFVAKLYACITTIVISTVVFVSLDFLLARSISGNVVDLGKFVLASATLGLIEIWFLVFGILLTQLMPRIRSIVPVALASSFGFVILGFIAASANDETLRYLSPYRYFLINYTVAHSGYDTKYLIIWMLSILIMLGVGIGVFIRRDVKAAD